MRIHAANDRQRWSLAALVSVGLGLGVVLLFRAPSVEPPAEHFNPKAIAGIGLLRVASSDAALVDPTPLFLPTIWNSAEKSVALPKPGGAFANYPAKFAYDEFDFKAPNARSQSMASASDLLALLPPGSALLGVGRGGSAGEPLPRRGGCIEVSQLTGGSVVLKEALPPLPFPEMGLWEPVELLATVDASGLSGPLVVTARSKADEIDAYIKNYLTNSVQLGAKLRPGIYRIRVGP